MEYKQTLNMNKSGFPMRGGLPMREPDMLKNWQELDLYNELLKKNEGKPLFALHDGPPFSNGALHMGHALNKCIKDFMIRSAAMRGYYTPYIPGWDNHGMPIESAIIKQNKLNHKAMPIPEFRSACHDFAQHYIDVQMEGFKRLGVVADWEHPYKTMAPSFEAEEVKVFGAMYKKGYIYKGLKPVYWCYHDETALAEAEIEYQDDPCTTVYVKFPLHDDQGKLTDEERKNLSFVIWTTTIWTLPGNLAIALNPVESYVIVRNNQNGEQYLVAEALMEKVMKVGGVEDYTVASRHEGACLREARRPARMRVDDAAAGRECLVKHQMRRRIARRLPLAFDDIAVQINDDHIIFRHAVIRHAGGLDDNETTLPVDGRDIAPRKGHKVMLRQRQIGLQYLLFQCFQHCFSSCLQNACTAARCAARPLRYCAR